MHNILRAFRLESLAIFLVINLALCPVVLVSLFSIEIASQFGVPVWAAKSLYGAYFICAGTTARLLQNLWNRMSFRSSVLLGCMGLASGMLLIPICSSFMQLVCVFSFFCACIGGAPFFAPTVSYIVRSFGPNTAFALAFATCGQLTCFVFWRTILSFMEAPDWRLVFPFFGVSGAVGIALLVVSFHPSQPTFKSRFSQGFEINKKVVLLYSVAYLAVCFLATTLIIDFSSRPAAAAISTFSLFSLLGRIGFALAYDYGFRRASLNVSAGLIALAVSFYLVSGEVWYWLPPALLGVGYGAFPPLMLSRLNGVFANDIVSINAGLLYFGSIGIAGGSLLMPLLNADPFFTSLLLTLFILVFLCSWIWAEKKLRAMTY